MEDLKVVGVEYELSDFLSFKSLPASQDVENVEGPAGQSQNLDDSSQLITTEQAVWTRNATLQLMDQYKTLREKVGTFQIRNFKLLWKSIANNMDNKFTPQQVENLRRVLERAYKKYVDNQNKTGLARKNFEFFEEMHEIFKYKKNVYPTILLSGDADTPVLDCRSEESDISPPSSSILDPEVVTPTTSCGFYRKKREARWRKEKNDLINIKKDYYSKMLDMYQQRLAMEAIRTENSSKRIRLLEEKNELLRSLNK